MTIIKDILENRLTEAKDKIDEMLVATAQRKLVECRKMISATRQIDEEYDYVVTLEEGRFKIVRAKVRAGKVLRRHKEATKAGFTMRGGKVTKMSPKERRNRKLSQRKAAKKRKGKLSRSRMNTKKALRKRRAMGL
jgi:hypothetical protein